MAGIALLALAWAVPAAALTQATLITRSLDRRPVKLAAVGGDVVSYFDEHRSLQQQPLHRYVRIEFDPPVRDIEATPRSPAAPTPRTPPRTLPPDGPETSDVAPDPVARPTGWITLTDGSRFAGSMSGIDPDGAILWRHPMLGELRAGLDGVRSLRLTAAGLGADASRADRVEEQDVLTLRNGERLVGLVTRIDDAGVEVLVEQVDEPVAVAWARVAGVSLANPPAEGDPGRLQRLRLIDGSVVFAGGLELVDATVAAEVMMPGGPAAEVELPVEVLAAIDLTAGGVSLIDLVDLPFEVVEPADVFGARLDPILVGGDLRLHAPQVLSWSLPAEATRLAVELRLDLDGVPLDHRGWAYVTVEFDGGTGEPQAVTLTADDPAAYVVLPLGRAPLVVTLDDAINGPVLDRVRLAGGRVLVEGEPAPRSGY